MFYPVLLSSEILHCQNLIKCAYLPQHLWDEKMQKYVCADFLKREGDIKNMNEKEREYLQGFNKVVNSKTSFLFY